MSEDSLLTDAGVQQAVLLDRSIRDEVFAENVTHLCGSDLDLEQVNVLDMSLFWQPRTD